MTGTNDNAPADFSAHDSSQSPPPISNVSSNKNILDHIRIAYQKSFKLEGRASRAEFWSFGLFGITILILSVFLIGFSENFLYVYLLFALFSAPANICIVVRRYHDLNKGGGWFFIQFIPYIGSLIMLIWFLFPGTNGENDYGSVE